MGVPTPRHITATQRQWESKAKRDARTRAHISCAAAQVEDSRAALLLLRLRPGEGAGAWRRAVAKECTAEARAVCVTGGISFLGLAVVERLLRHGYSVRLALETQEDLDKLREMDVFAENGRDGVWVVMTNDMDLESLYRAFDGCVGVFHTSSLVDLGGISGYTGLGITLFGMAYMFVHDGLVHRRFPVGPIKNVPYFRRVAAAHQIHHMDKFDSVPYGLFLGPKELEEVGGTEELEKEVQRRIKRRQKSDAMQ